MCYVFSTTSFSPLDIKRLDAAVTHFTKGAIGLMGCTPKALVHEDISKGGFGMTSLLHSYVQEQTNTILKCLHDNGRLGSITKHMLLKQIQNLGLVPSMCAWQDSRYCSIARKLASIQEAGIDLAGPMEIL